MSPLVAYLQQVAIIHGTGGGTKEESYYPALATLFNGVGERLKPRVHCVIELKSLGAGHPDFGLFTDDQLTASDELKQTVAVPARGAGEVKGVAQDLGDLVDSDQVSKYWARYRQVLVTNLRQFAFVGEDAHGEPIEIERFTLAESAGGFWKMAQEGARLAGTETEADALAFFERCLRHAAPIDAPRDLAWFLASYARTARARLDALPPTALASLRATLQDALGVTFRGQKGERFFRATVVQTLFYGVFSAWTLWHRHDPDRRDIFTWHSAPHWLRLRILDRLFREVSGSTARQLGLTDLLDRTARTLARVKRERFFKHFQDAEAIQYFYEPFLEAYDPVLRKELGVWYTPPEVVRYMVARVDQALQSELGIERGLADERVVVLDPCCGTGAFLVETMRVIRRRLESEGGGALSANRLREAVLGRLFGFEILTAPFVVAHLQLGLALAAHGVPLADDQRAAIYLTNALTGWMPSQAEGSAPRFAPEFEEEVEFARAVKRSDSILVVLGNPPYDGYADVQVTGQDETELVAPYRETRRADVPAPRGQGLNDLYVRFFRIAERQIAERTGRGLVCYISNASWLDGLSHPALRERLLDAFDDIWIDNLNGDKYRTGKTTPDGDPDPSVFSTPSNREGIQVGTAVAVLARTDGDGTDTVQYRDFWGSSKLRQLDALAQDGSLGGLGMETPEYQAVTPEPALGLPFLHAESTPDYQTWASLSDLFPWSSTGIKTARDEVLVDIDRDQLEARMRRYFDPTVSDRDLAETAPAFFHSSRGYEPEGTRTGLQRRGFENGKIMPYLYRPFDVRWLYWIGETKLLDEKRADYVPHLLGKNPWLVAARRHRRGYDPPVVTSAAVSYHVNERATTAIPLYLAPDFGDAGEAVRENLSSQARAYLDRLGAERSNRPERAESAPTAADLFHHALAVLHAPAYRAENAGALRQDWPRIPTPDGLDALLASATLGRSVAALLDPETNVPGVTSGTIRPVLRGVAVPARVGGGVLDPAAGDLAVTARWGYLSRGAVMPGSGELHTRPFSPSETEALGDAAAVLGPGTVDVFLSERALWRGVPQAVWSYTLGGYPVLKKWLSYRQEEVLGRPLRADEAEAFQAIARRIAALLLLDDALDANYAAVRAPA